MVSMPKNMSALDEINLGLAGLASVGSLGLFAWGVFAKDTTWLIWSAVLDGGAMRTQLWYWRNKGRWS